VISALPSKTVLKEQLTSILATDLAVRERAYQAAREGATHEEAKPENDKDTRALEASYLARGEAKRLEEMRAALAETQTLVVRALDAAGPVALGALVVTDEDGTEAMFWLVPHGGGTRLADGTVQVVTPKSPLGQALLGARCDDECEVILAGKRRTLSIVRIA